MKLFEETTSFKAKTEATQKKVTKKNAKSSRLLYGELIEDADETQESDYVSDSEIEGAEEYLK